MNIVDEYWESYEEEVIPKEASEEQRIECRRAFFAGAASVFDLFEKLGLLPEEDAMRTLSSIQKELIQFVKDVREGRK